ncbi:hypothetical protein F5Y10DRAFT_242805 [Nemania abortiva]|nr:hypothetical protein F5Y10DRAFT_242805 [Nemania abortiva]
MAALKVPDTGLQLESSPSSKNYLPLQVFGITLNDGMIEDMIRSVQGGQNLELTLGSAPSFHYGSREEKVSVTPTSFDYDLYYTDAAGSGGKTQRLPHPTMSIWKKPPTSLSTKKVTKVTTKHTSRASSSGGDSDVDTRGGSSAQKSGKGTKLVNGGPKGSKLPPAGRSAMASVLSSASTRSLPTSPALNGVSSPNPAFSASQQILEKNKGQRSTLVHELAVRDQPFEHLKDVWTGADSDLKPTVEKVADFNKSTEKWSLKKRHWKELDVWNYEYDSPADRQLAIDNAIKVYDKQRVVLSDPVWDRLLPREDRNKNIVLSKLQASIAKQNATVPTPKSQKPEDGNKSDIDSSKAKGEVMSRSNSQPTANKPKKASEREAQTKRLLSNNPKKPAPKRPTSKAKATEEKGKKVLSEEYVYDTDTDEEQAPLSQSTTTSSKPKPPPKPVEKPVEKPVGRVAAKPKEPPASSVPLKPKPKPLVRPPRALGTTNKSPQKRPREDEDSSSSSGAPLSKRIKPKELPKPVTGPKATKHRASDASQNSRGTNSTVTSNFTAKSKNTSPTKSSPLATSPPTNASDLDERTSSQRPPIHSHQHPPQQHRNGARDRERGRDRGLGHSSTNGISTSTSTTSSVQSTTVVNKKRKARESTEESPETTPTPPTKKPKISPEILMQARKFTQFYKKYEALHYEIAALKEPPEDKLSDLVEMRERLATMKGEIQRAAAAAA